MEKQLTVQELIDELSKFNPNAYIINDNFEDVLMPRFGWCNMEGDKSGERDIDREKREATYISLHLVNKINNYSSCLNFDERPHE
jgi:hypothetical protein